MKIIHSQCDKELSKDKTLPRNSYLVSYILDDWNYDIVQSNSMVEIFDHYYDKYGDGVLQKIQWNEGTVNPKLWGIDKPKKKR